MMPYHRDMKMPFTLLTSLHLRRVQHSMIASSA